MYASGIDIQNLDGLDGLDALCCDDCAQLRGMGLVSSTPTAPSSTSIIQTIGTEIEKILGRSTVPGSGATYPISTPPYTPSYPINTGTYAQAPPPSMFSTPSNWLPWALAAGVLVVLASRKG